MPKSKNMEIVLSAHLHVVNGTRHVVEYPELKGTKFSSFKEKERFKRQKVREILKDDTNIPEDQRADFIFMTVELPEGVTELPENWLPDPIIIAKESKTQPIFNETTDAPKFKWQKPQMKKI